MKEIECKFCGKKREIANNNNKTRFCNSSCAGKFGAQKQSEERSMLSKSKFITPCEKCGITPESKYSSGRFCSSKCARSFSTASRRKEISQKVSDALKGRSFKLGLNKIQKLKNCEGCGSQFECLGKITDEGKRFCSKSCATRSTGPFNDPKVHLKNAERLRERSRLKGYAAVQKVCGHCKKEFEVRWWKRNATYCSKPCASKVVNSNPEKRAKASQRMIERNINGNFIQSFGRRVTYDKNGVNIRCDSLIEWCALEDLFQSHGVNGIKSIERSSARIPYEKDGIQHVYNPDFEVRLSNGTHLIIECKSEQHGKSDTWRRYHADSILKRPLLENYCVMIGAVPVWFTQKTRKDLYAMIQKLS
jgi:hypothetical protein